MCFNELDFERSFQQVLVAGQVTGELMVCPETEDCRVHRDETVLTADLDQVDHQERVDRPDELVCVPTHTLQFI